MNTTRTEEANEAEVKMRGLDRRGEDFCRGQHQRTLTALNALPKGGDMSDDDTKDDENSNQNRKVKTTWLSKIKHS
jgi:hypothetical protein